MKKNLLMLLSGVALAFPALAEDFVYEYEGQAITYTVLDEEAKTCETKLGSSEYSFETWSYVNIPGNEVKGALVLPANPKNGDVEYTLVALADNSFIDCKELTSIVIPATVTRSGDYAFEGCSGLEKTTFASMEALLNIEFVGGGSANPMCYSHNLFIGDEQVTNPVVPEGTEVLKNYVFTGLKGMTSIELPSTLTSIGDGVFNSCSDLESISIPEGVTSLGMGAFMFCESLTSIDIPASMTSIAGYCFNGCDAITKANFASIESLVNINFADTYSNPLKGANLYIAGKEVKDVVIPESIVEIKPYAFYEANYITSVSMPGNVGTIGKFAFNHCYNMTSLQLSNALVEIGDQAFEGCPAVPDVLIPPMVAKVGKNAFNNCSGILKSAYPEELGANPFIVKDPWGFSPDTDFGGLSRVYNGAKASIADGLLYTDAGTSLIYVPTTVKSVDVPAEVVYIAENAFAFCAGLEKLVLPENLIALSQRAFSDSPAIKAVECRSTLMAPMAFADCFDQAVYDNATLYVPVGCKDMYAAADCWMNFSKIEEGSIPDAEPVEIKKMSVVGSFNGWGESSSLNMVKIDEGVWKAKAYNFSGEFKFRANDSWDINFGAAGDGLIDIDGKYSIVADGKNFNIAEEAYEVTFKLDLNDMTLRIEGVAPLKLALRGSFNDWNYEKEYVLSEGDSDGSYLCFVDEISKDAEFKIASEDWKYVFTTSVKDMKPGEYYDLDPDNTSNMGFDNSYTQVFMLINIEKGYFTYFGEIATGVARTEILDGKARYFNLQGQEVENPEGGIFIRVVNGKSEKIIVR